MWATFRTAPNRVVARMWQELFEEEGIPCKLWVELDQLDLGDAAPHRVLIPLGRTHVAEEVLRQLKR